MPLNKKIFFLLCSLLFINAFDLAPAGAQDLKKTLILPFQVHSKAQAREIQAALQQALSEQFGKVKKIQLLENKDLLTSLEGKIIDTSLAGALGRQTGADYVLTGSVTELGDVLNVDVRITDVARGAQLPAIYAQGKAGAGVGPLAAALLGDALVRMGAEQRIARIEFKGNRRIEGTAINQVLKSATGGVFSETNLAQDIKAIYKMGYFTDVSAQVSDVPEGKVLIFSVQEKGIITAIEIRGNKAISKDDIEAVLTVRAKQILNQEKIKADVARIKELYDNKGYYNALISEVVEKEGEKDSRVIFAVEENERLYLRSIAFSGNEAYKAEELRKLMTVTEKGFFSFFTDSGILKKEQLKQDVEKINAFYLNNGFIYAQIGEPEISHDSRGIYIKIPITEGKQYNVGKVEITGDELRTPRADLLGKLFITRKKYYAREAVLKDIDYLQQVCSDEGYAYAEVLPRTKPEEKELTVDVTYHIEKGKQVYFHRINITGNTKTRDKVIRRLLTVVEGDLYSRSKLKQSYMAINRLRYFEEVDFQTEKGPAETLTDLNIRIKEKPTGMFSIGAGYSALDNVIFTAQVSQQNLFGRGQSLSLKANIGGRSTYYELSFVEPWLFDIPLWSKADLWNTWRIYDTYRWSSRGGGFTFGYPVWQYVTAYAGYRLSSDSVSDIDINASSFIKRQEGDIISSNLTFTLARDTTDDIMFPSTGSKSSASVEYAGGILQGDASFVKYILTTAKYFSLPLDTVIGLRGRGGYLQETEGKDAPVYERFTLGGINSLRGLRSVGPLDPFTGDVIGGLTMLNFNAEFLFPLIKNAGMRGLFFYDTGNSWTSGYHLNDLRKTAGTGVRWYSPIGPLRLEWGYVLDPKEGESRTRWEFTMGMLM